MAAGWCIDSKLQCADGKEETFPLSATVWPIDVFLIVLDTSAEKGDISERTR